jgi:hypothetical protein
MKQLSRREAIHRVGLLLGGTIAAPTLAGVLGGCRAPAQGEAYAFKVLDLDRQKLVAAIADHIIPRTDTPGASEVGVTEFFDLMLADWYPAAERDQFLSSLDAFDASCAGQYGSGFVDCEESDQILALQEAAAATAVARSVGDRPLPAFATLKELTMVGYYTSETGMTIELQHVEVPGVYNGCVPIDEVGRTWA